MAAQGTKIDVAQVASLARLSLPQDNRLGFGENGSIWDTTSLD